MRTFFVDTETCGLTGPIVIIQYAEDDGPVTIHEVWKRDVGETLDLIKTFCNNNVCAFNLAFDWFQLTKLYNILEPLPYRNRPPSIDDVRRIAASCPTHYCLRPAGALDLLCVARKSEWQSLMDRRDITIRRVPIQVAQTIVDYLNKTLPFDDIYFSRKKVKERWKIKAKPGSAFVDIILKFAASMKLKVLVSEIFKVSTKEIGIPKEWYPQEDNHNPYTLDWVNHIDKHIQYWGNSKNGRTYAENDIIYLQRLYHYFGDPSFDDTDSSLACCIGATRWCGFRIDEYETTRQYKEALEQQKEVLDLGINVNSPLEVLAALRSIATDAQKLVIPNSSAETLKKLMKFFPDTQLATLAKLIQAARVAKKKCDLFNALLTTGRFCPDLKIVGTLSGRMSGGSDEGKIGKSVNPQGISKNKKIRKIFSMADEGEVLSYGDFWSFEVTIADAAFSDATLRSELLSGKSFHGLLGCSLYNLPYDEVVATSATANDLYKAAKSTTFGYFYGAQIDKLAKTAGISTEEATKAFDRLTKKYQGLGRFRDKINRLFSSLKQDTLGGPIFYTAPSEFVQSLLGFKRSFSLENRTIRALYDLANSLGSFGFCKETTVNRRNKTQTLTGATQSAIYAAAFNLQASIIRAALNHVIQSTGGELTKELQRQLWELQPTGVHPYRIRILNVHDELVCVHSPTITGQIGETVEKFIVDHKQIVPLLAMDWYSNVKSWGDKPEDGQQIAIYGRTVS